jgi:hypothetical protein
MDIHHGSCDLIKEDLIIPARRYHIENPSVPTGQVFLFTTDSGLLYEVRFGRKTDNYFGHVVNFGVKSDEFENEYSTTNKGELFIIIPTVIEIICRYQHHHPRNNYYEFTGEFKESHDSQEASIRSRFYLRIAKRYINSEVWSTELHNNKVIIRKIAF